MSYDWHMQMDCGAGPLSVGNWDLNYTYNVGGMFADALGRGMTELDGMLGKDAGPLLREAHARMLRDPQKYRAMEPDNGWGDYEGALDCLSTLAQWCAAAPNAQLSVG